MAAADNPTGRPTIDVRKNAEQRVPKTPTDVSGMSAEEIGGLLYELQLHQEELKIQNEELRRTQLELESAHERLADLYDFAPVGYVTVDANGLITNANLATATMLGQDRSKIVGTRLALYCEEGSRIQLHDHIEKVLASKTSQGCELKFTTPSGATLDVRLHSNRLAASGTGDGWKCRVIMTDITEDKLAESDLRESEERFRRLVENSPFCIHEIELDGTLSAVNAAGLAMARLSDASELYGVEYLNEVSESDRPRIGKLLDLARHGQTSHFELENSIGQAFESCFVPLSDGAGKVRRIMGIAQDISQRRRAEVALRESERFFRTIFEQAAVGVAQLNSISGAIIRFNPRYSEILGIPAESLVGTTWTDLTHPDDVATKLASRERLLAGDIREFAIEKRVQRPDGSFVWVHLTVSPMWQPGEEPSTHIAIVQDITERKQAEEEHRRLLDILQRSLNEIYVWDAETLRFEYINTSALTNLGYTLDAMLSMTPVDIKPAYTETTFRDLLAPLRSEKEELLRFETLHQRADGSCYPVEVHLQLIRRENNEAFLAVILDISERKGQEQRYRAIVETTQDWIWEIDLQGVHTYSNPAIETLLGYSVEEIVGGNAFDLMHEQDRKVVEGELPRLVAQQQGWTNWLVRWRHHDGSIRHLESNANPILDWNGQLIGFRGADRDVTDRVRADDLLRLSEERYRSLVRASAATIWTTNPEGGFSSRQPMWEAFTGQAWEEHREHGWARMLHPDDAERMTREWREAVDRPQPHFTDGRIFHAATGEYRYCELHATPLLNPDGSIREWFGITIDIQDRRRAESALAMRSELLEAIRKIQAEFVAGEAPNSTFDKLLAVLLNVTAGDYGFIGEILHDDAGVPFLKTHAITNVAWDDATRKFYDEQALAGLEFSTLETLFGTVITSGRAVITNDPANDPRRGGLPPGHPPLNAFMGLPIYTQNKLVGMVGVANCPGGVGKELVNLLDPFLATCGNLIDASRRERDRRETEDALRESRERFRQLAESIDEVFWLHDLVAHKVLYVSPRYEKTWGRTTEALYADPLEWANAIHPEDRERVEKSFLEQAALDEWVEEYRIVRPDATERCIRDRAFPIRDESGNPIRLAGVSEDITEQKNAELALRESEEKFRVLSEKSPAIVLITRRDRILYCNSALSAITGYSREELLRMPLQTIIHPDHHESITDRQHRRLNGEDVPRRYDGKIVTKSGEERWLDVSAELIEFEEAPAVLVTCVNVTERKLTEAALRQSEETLRALNASLEQHVVERTAELAETNAELSAFAHTVSHDLRAPLRAMEGFAAALAEDYGEQLDEDARQFIRHIIDAAKRMDALVNDLLTFSRLGRKELPLKVIRLESIVAEARRQLSSQIEACDAILDIADQMPTVLGHKATLVQVVANLLSNAMKFVAVGVRPEIRTWSERRDDGMIRLWVEDNGIGIEDTYRDRIFQVFERLHGIESYPGTGIGLAIVARACERLGCCYGFESQRDHGSRFWVEFQAGDTNP